MDIGSRIKAIRVNKKMTQKELAESINTSTAYIYQWEAGVRRPNADNIREICKALNISADTLLDLPPKRYESIGSFEVTENERRVLVLYRQLDDFGREAVELIANHEKTRIDFKEGNITNFKTADGERYIPKYISAAAAGIAAPIDDAEYEMIRVGKNVPENADYAVVISGKSMEPYIRDGETVYVEKTEELQTGEIGIFSVDGSTVCKMLYKSGIGDIYLVSANPDESASNVFVPHDSSDTVTCLGRVILKKGRVLPDYFMDSLLD